MNRLARATINLLPERAPVAHATGRHVPPSRLREVLPQFPIKQQFVACIRKVMRTANGLE